MRLARRDRTPIFRLGCCVAAGLGVVALAGSDFTSRDVAPLDRTATRAERARPLDAPAVPPLALFPAALGLGLRAGAPPPPPALAAAEPAPPLAPAADAGEPEAGDDFLLAGAEQGVDIAAREVRGLTKDPPASRKRRGGLTILQIGDSHTAADYFTGEARRLLQARFRDGGPGYMAAGRPHLGVRSAAMNVSASAGWTYSALQKSEDAARFHLSGFDARSTHGGETLTFAAADAVAYDRIDLETVTGPGHGDIEVTLDGQPPARFSLASPRSGRSVIRLAARAREGALRRLQIRSLDDRPVVVSGLAVLNRSRGVSYSNVGFPGATIDIVDKYDAAMLQDELKRLAPQIVVLAFGVNEGFNDNLDMDRYRERYREALDRIRRAAPDARIVMIGPPQANRVPAACVKTPGACPRGARDALPPPLDLAGPPQPPSAFAPVAARAQSCPFPTPPRLDLVRETQRRIAREENIAYWDWAAIMPSRCGAHAWTKADPPLMTADHVHFTAEGYRVGARAFVRFLTPVVEQIRRGKYALSDP